MGGSWGWDWGWFWVNNYLWWAKQVKDTAYNQEKHFIKAVHVKRSLELKWLSLKLRISSRIESKIHIFLYMKAKAKEVPYYSTHRPTKSHAISMWHMYSDLFSRSHALLKDETNVPRIQNDTPRRNISPTIIQPSALKTRWKCICNHLPILKKLFLMHGYTHHCTKKHVRPVVYSR